MTIYSQITHNKVKTVVIMLLFILMFSGFFYVVGQYFESPVSYLILGFTFSIVSIFGSYFYSDKLVLLTVGARPATKNEFFDFYTVTENLCIASGTPMPKLYVIDDTALNAFATGRDPKHAIVCTTTALLKTLERAELEGVIAHELSHIKNYDILLATIVAVLVGTIALIADWIMRSLWWRRGSHREDKNPLLCILLLLALIITPIIATLIQLAISRRREFLADASGALLTRYPEGLARALEKIAGDRKYLMTATSSTAHLFISNPFKKGKKDGSSWFTSLFSTHPPIQERIKVLRSM